jgi:soluble lytic murein transglycosylase
MKTKTIIFAALIASFSSFASTDASRSIASIKNELRVDHARELLGKFYKKSVVSKFEQKKDLEKTLTKIVKERLPKKYKHQAMRVSSAIIREASKHGMDPYFVSAVISGESSFNPIAVGPVGEIGLMQIRPTTGEWIAKRIKLPWKGEKTLRDPVSNIKLGTAYIAWLREKFSGHSQLYLAAYNMGARSVKNAVGRNVWPKDYPRHVMKRYIALYREI